MVQTDDNIAHGWRLHPLCLQTFTLYKMLFGIVFLAFRVFFEASVLAQAPNTLAQTYPYDRTMSNNGSQSVHSGFLQ